MTAKRITQLIAALNVLIMLVALVLYVSASNRPPMRYPGLWPVDSLVYSVLAILILARYPRHLLGWLSVVTGLAMAVATLMVYGLQPYFDALELTIRSNWVQVALSLLVEATWVVGFLIPLIAIPLFFPNGRLPSPRWRPIVLVGAISAVGGIVGTAAESEPALFGLGGYEGLLDLFNGVVGVASTLALLGALAAIVVRYRRSRGIERQQMKWLVYTAVVGIALMFLLVELLGEESPLISLYATSLPALLAVAIGIAILRHGLYDIDILIRRTLQYGLVTGLLALAYFGLVVTLQALFAAAGGQQSPLSIVLSTLAIAALFTPVRRRVQQAVDRRFYRQKYDARQALARFAAASRDEVDLERLAAALLAVADETMQPEQIYLWLAPEERPDR